VAFPAAAVFCDPLLKAESQESPWLHAAALGDLRADDVPRRVVVRLAPRDAWATYPEEAIGEVYLRRSRAGDRLAAIEAASPDNGCPVAFDSAARRFRELCHDSTYDLEGRLVGGPGRHDLRHLDVERRGDEIWVRFRSEHRIRSGRNDRRPG
jgi:Rieske Fe-S protein